jgi:hypothetical protein
MLKSRTLNGGLEAVYPWQVGTDVEMICVLFPHHWINRTAHCCTNVLCLSWILLFAVFKFTYVQYDATVFSSNGWADIQSLRFPWQPDLGVAVVSNARFSCAPSLTYCSLIFPSPESSPLCNTFLPFLQREYLADALVAPQGLSAMRDHCVGCRVPYS